MEFSRQEYWNGLPFPFQGIFPTQGSNPGLLHCRQALYGLNHQGSLSKCLFASFLKEEMEAVQGVLPGLRAGQCLRAQASPPLETMEHRVCRINPVPSFVIHLKAL